MFTRILLGCVVVCGLAFASRADEPKEKETKLKPTLVFRGSHSASDREMFYVVTDETGWKQLWEKHRGDEKTRRFTERDQILDVDFDTHYVVAIFVAPGWNWCEVTPRKRGGEVVIGFRTIIYGIVGRFGTKDKRTEYEKAKEDAVAPYAFVVLPKPVSTVVIEKDVRRDKFGSPAWEEQKRFPVPKGK